MNRGLAELLALEGVRGVVVIGAGGEVLAEQYRAAAGRELMPRQWRRFSETLPAIRELDLVFERGRLYGRRTTFGYLLVITDRRSAGAMVRLHCDILVPELSRVKPGRLKKLFNR